MQLKNAIQELDPSLRCVAIYGGTQLANQIQQLNGHVDIVCATPGRLRDLMQRQNFNPSQIEMVCLDEADELLTPNFFEQIEEVLDAVSDQKQMLLFSATINDNVRDLINKYSRSPKVIDLTSGQAHKLPENVKHFIMDAPQVGHADVAQWLIAQYNSERCILFTNTKRNAISISTQLNDNGIRSFDLHSDHSQSKREKTFRDFRRGLFKVLVATDVASRGIDIPEVDLVVHSGVPPNGLDYYIHRSGRTGRGGRPGTSILLSTNERMESSRLHDIKRVVKFTTLPVPQDLKEKFSKMRVDDRYNQTRPFGSNRGYGSNRYEPKSNYESNRYEPYESRDNDRANRFTPKYRASNGKF
jgi:superfamily II DNA/RNA helicase